MIRPSALQLADAGCGHAARLGELHPEGSLKSERGLGIHGECDDHTKGRKQATSAEARAIIAVVEEAVASKPGSKLESEIKVELRDPEDDSLVTEGTADLAWMGDNGTLYVLDIKTGRPEYLPHVDESMQLHAYALGLALARGATSYQIGFVVLIDERAEIWWSVVFGEDSMKGMLARLRAAASRPDVAVVAGHCDGCFQRRHCSAWLLPAYEGETALEPFTRVAGLTADNAGKALHVVAAMKKAIDVAEAHLRDFARVAPISDGKGKIWGPSWRAGRKTADVKQLEADGLGQYVRVGSGYEVFTWRKA